MYARAIAPFRTINSFSPAAFAAAMAIAVTTTVIFISVVTTPAATLAGQYSGGGAPAFAASPMQEVHIANSGATLLRGARISVITPAEIRVTLGWGTTAFQWSVPMNPNTQFVNSSGEKMERGDLRIGDTVTITGTLVPASIVPTVNAQYIRVSKSLATVRL